MASPSASSSWRPGRTGTVKDPSSCRMMLMPRLYPFRCASTPPPADAPRDVTVRPLNRISTLGSRELWSGGCDENRRANSDRADEPTQGVCWGGEDRSTGDRAPTTSATQRSIGDDEQVESEFSIDFVGVFYDGDVEGGSIRFRHGETYQAVECPGERSTSTRPSASTSPQTQQPARTAGTRLREPTDKARFRRISRRRPSERARTW